MAFLGDAVWSLLVRRMLVEQGKGKGSRLQKEAVAFVSAFAQASFYDALHEKNFFTEEEEGWYHRGRNGQTGSVPKNTPVMVYRKSTGFEAILGGLELTGNRDRIETIWQAVRDLEGEKVCHN